MKTVGIVAEYNPFHAGHRKQFDRVKAEFGGETAIVCAMSGNYVQRGAPAVMDKTLRAKAARRLRRRPCGGAANHREPVLRRGVRRGRHQHSVQTMRYPLLRRGNRRSRAF